MKRKTSWRKKWLVKTREPMRGQRCRLGADIDQLQCLFSCLSSLSGVFFLLFPKGIKAAIHAEFQEESWDIKLEDWVLLLDTLCKWTDFIERKWGKYCINVVYFFAFLSSRTSVWFPVGSVFNSRQAENVFFILYVKKEKINYAYVLIFRPYMYVLCNDLYFLKMGCFIYIFHFNQVIFNYLLLTTQTIVKVQPFFHSPGRTASWSWLTAAYSLNVSAYPEDRLPRKCQTTRAFPFLEASSLS